MFSELKQVLAPGSFRGQVGPFTVNATSKSINLIAPGLRIAFENPSGFSILLNSRTELNGKKKNDFVDMRLEYAF